MKKSIYLFFILLHVFKPLSAQDYQPTSVRVIYLVSSDRMINPLYKRGIEMAVKDIRGWYKKQMRGRTFRINTPLVEVLKSNQKADWFRKNPVEGLHKDNWNYYNALNEVTRILDVPNLDTENFTWIIYSDGPGNTGRGGGGICIMPEDDLLGLIGYHPTQKEINRWIAGLGHELGHAFGLPHPEDTEKHADAIMWTGIYGKYPNQTYLTNQDKALLDKSPFFNLPKPPQKILSETKYEYQGGTFTRIEGSDHTRWLETKSDSNASFSFEESGQDEHHYFLLDPARNMTIKLPKAGGQTYWSMDNGQSWNPLYPVNAPASQIKKKIFMLKRN